VYRKLGGPLVKDPNPTSERKDYYAGVKNLFRRIEAGEFGIFVRLPLHIVKREEFEAGIEYFGLI
jgi:hypothetical protein